MAWAWAAGFVISSGVGSASIATPAPGEEAPAVAAYVESAMSSMVSSSSSCGACSASTVIARRTSRPTPRRGLFERRGPAGLRQNVPGEFVGSGEDDHVIHNGDRPGEGDEGALLGLTSSFSFNASRAAPQTTEKLGILVAHGRLLAGARG